MKEYKATDPEMIQAQKDLAEMSNLSDRVITNDNEYEEESYGSGSALEFHGNELEQIDNPSTDLINKCKEVINLFKEVAQ